MREDLNPDYKGNGDSSNNLIGIKCYGSITFELFVAISLGRKKN